MESNFYTRDELDGMGLGKIGKDVLLSRKCSIYGAKNIRLGNHIRIDDYSILSGNICIGDYVHISAGVYLFAGETGIDIGDYVAISSHSSVYAVSDDYLGNAMCNPTIPEQYRKVEKARVIIEKHVLIGAGSVILPGVHLKEGSSFGSMTLINKDSKAWVIYMGTPMKEWKERKKMPLLFEKELRNY